jgi:hypothetical protein
VRRRALLEDATEERTTSEDPDALVLGFPAYDTDTAIAAKLASASGSTNATDVYEKLFKTECNAICTKGRPNPNVLATGRRTLGAWRAMRLRCAALALRALLRADADALLRCRAAELCDNCWCRQNRPCTVSPPYGVCMRCMDEWSACAPTTSHYSTTSDPLGLEIRKQCAAKQPTEAADARQGAVVPPGSFLADATKAGGRRMLSRAH